MKAIEIDGVRKVKLFDLKDEQDVKVLDDNVVMSNVSHSDLQVLDCFDKNNDDDVEI